MLDVSIVTSYVTSQSANLSSNLHASFQAVERALSTLQLHLLTRAPARGVKLHVRCIITVQSDRAETDALLPSRPFLFLFLFFPFFFPFFLLFLKLPDGSAQVAGVVALDTVNPGLEITNQQFLVIDRASGFTNDEAAGLLGMAFSILATVRLTSVASPRHMC